MTTDCGNRGKKRKDCRKADTERERDDSEELRDASENPGSSIGAQESGVSHVELRAQ